MKRVMLILQSYTMDICKHPNIARNSYGKKKKKSVSNE